MERINKIVYACATALAWGIVLLVIVMAICGCSTMRQVEKTDVKRERVTAERLQAVADWHHSMVVVDTTKYVRTIEIVRYDTLQRVKEKVTITETKDNAVVTRQEDEAETAMEGDRTESENEEKREEEEKVREPGKPVNWRLYAVIGVAALGTGMWVAGKCNFRRHD